MQITLRTLAGSGTPHDVQPTDTVRAVKEFLSAEYDLASLKLCFKGKVLEEEKTFEELGFTGGEVLIIAGRKQALKAATTVTTPSPAVTPQSEQATPPLPQPTQPPVAPAKAASAPAAEPSGAETPEPVAASGTSPQHGVDSSLIDSIVSMGFDDRNQVALALRAAYMNPDRAVEYLCTGIPPAALAQFQQDRPPAPQRVATQPSPGGVTPDALSAALGSAVRDGGAAMTPLRAALSGIPQFEQIRAVVRQNPSSLSTVMQQLRQHHPAVFQLVQDNPQEFLALMNETAPAPASVGAGAQQFQLTDADREPVQRLVAIGGGMWDERAAAIVYLVCNRSEDVAANVLFDNGGLPAELAAAVMEGGVPEGEDFEEDPEDEGH